MRKHVLCALCAALALSTPSGGATHGPLAFTYTVSPTTAGSVSDVSWWVSSPVPFASTVVHAAPGERWAHADDQTSPVSPPPAHGDVVGTVNHTSDLLVNGCGAGDTQAYTLSWVEPIGSGTPSGTVAELRVSGSFLGLTLSRQMFVVLHGDHYDVVAPDWPDELTCSSSAV